MATTAVLSPVSPIQIPCKLILDYDFEEEAFPPCAKFTKNLPQTPSTPSSFSRATGKRTRGNEFGEVSCASPRKRQVSPRKLQARVRQKRESRVKNVERRVRFSQDSKQFDGLQSLSEALEFTVWNFYSVQNIRSADDILSLFKSRPRYRAVFEQVGAAIDHLAELLDKTTCIEATVPVLPRGGGRGLLLGHAHSPTFKKLQEMFRLALKHVQ